MFDVYKTKYMRLYLNKHPLNIRDLSLILTPIPCLPKQVNRARHSQHPAFGEVTATPEFPMEDLQHSLGGGHRLPHAQRGFDAIPQCLTYLTTKVWSRVSSVCGHKGQVSLSYFLLVYYLVYLLIVRAFSASCTLPKRRKIMDFMCIGS